MLTVVSKQIEKSNIVFVFGVLPPSPDPAQFFSLFSEGRRKGSTFANDPVFNLSLFEFPEMKMRFVFEKNKMRVEDGGYRAPRESKCVSEIYRVALALFKDIPLVAYGMNYEAIFKMNNVIPSREMMANVIHKDELESVRDFGWQYTLARDKGKRLETYLLKAVSPLEFAVHSNFHFDCLPDHKGASSKPFADAVSEASLKERFEKCYNDVDKIFSGLAF